MPSRRMDFLEELDLPLNLLFYFQVKPMLQCPDGEDPSTNAVGCVVHHSMKASQVDFFSLSEYQGWHKPW